MPLQFIVSTGADQPSQRYDVDKAPVTGGSGADCQVPLTNAPEHVFHIEHAAAEGWRLIPLAPQVNLLLNGHPIPGAAALHNGDHIALPGYDILFAVRFARAGHGRASDLVQILTVLLVVLAVGGEIAVITVLPGILRREEYWTHEIARQRLLMTLDGLRHVAANTPAEAASRRRAVDQLVLVELDRMGAHLRAHGEQLNPEQVHQLQTDLDAFDRILREDLPPPVQLEAGAALERLLEEEKP